MSEDEIILLDKISVTDSDSSDLKVVLKAGGELKMVCEGRREEEEICEYEGTEGEVRNNHLSTIHNLTI